MNCAYSVDGCAESATTLSVPALSQFSGLTRSTLAGVTLTHCPIGPPEPVDHTGVGGTCVGVLGNAVAVAVVATWVGVGGAGVEVAVDGVLPVTKEGGWA